MSDRTYWDLLLWSRCRSKLPGFVARPREMATAIASSCRIVVGGPGECFHAVENPRNVKVPGSAVPSPIQEDAH